MNSNLLQLKVSNEVLFTQKSVSDLYNISIQYSGHSATPFYVGPCLQFSTSVCSDFVCVLRAFNDSWLTFSCAAFAKLLYIKAMDGTNIICQFVEMVCVVFFRNLLQLKFMKLLPRRERWLKVFSTSAIALGNGPVRGLGGTFVILNLEQFVSNLFSCLWCPD